MSSAGKHVNSLKRMLSRARLGGCRLDIGSALSHAKCETEHILELRYLQLCKPLFRTLHFRHLSLSLADPIHLLSHVLTCHHQAALEL